MPKESAFKPKIESEKISDKQEVAIEKPLKSLEEDKSQISGFNLALEAVLGGGLKTVDQLYALANPRFDYRGSLMFPRGGSADISFTEGGRIISRDDVEGKRLVPEEIPILAKIVEERNSAKTEKENVETRISGFNLALEAVLGGGLKTVDQLYALANPRFDYRGSLMFPRGGSADISFTEGGRIISRDDVEGKRLVPEEIPILAKIVEERNSAKTEKENVETRISGFNLALEAVLGGGLKTVDQLYALANPRFDYRGSLMFPRGGSADISFTEGGRIISRDDVEGKRLVPEDLKLAEQLLGIVKNPAFADEVKENLKRYLKTNDGTMLDRLETILADSGNDTMSAEVKGIVADLIKDKRIKDVKKDIYGGIAGNKPIPELLQRIAQFGGKEASDLNVVAELQNAVAAKRKRDVLAVANQSLQGQKRNIDKALADAGPLLGSNRADDREVGLKAVELAYRAELANFKSEVQKMINKDVDPEMLRIYIDGLPIRPTVGDIDYVKTVVETREKGFQSVEEIIKKRRLESAIRIRESFSKMGVDLVLTNIEDFPSETERDRAIKVQLLDLYRSYVATNRPDIFDTQFAEEIKKRENAELEAKFISPELEKNKEAFNYMRTRFVEAIYPLVESMRADQATAGKVNSFLKVDKTKGDAENPRRLFEQRVSWLERQRTLTGTEKRYLDSVEMLSLFNPYLVACAFTDLGVTSEFMKHHFDKISNETAGNLKNGDYFPAIQIGLGPDGMAAIGEVVRSAPDLANAMLIVDAGKQPGGPFAIPEGPAWELNSANRRGARGRTLPKKPNSDELKTVRAYGSPLRWYPGERDSEKDVRQGSINSTVDYLPTPDELSTARYPTNEELQVILALQAAMLTKHVALQTRFVDLEENKDPNIKGDKLVTLEITDPKMGSVRRVKLGTDACFPATGLGESGYGFKLKGSRAEKVMEATKKSDGFPKISRTLEAFNSFAGRSKEQVSPGETLVIYGRGNSADTLIEYVSNIFQGDNPRVRDVTKVYIIADGDLSSRPRYALINDLKPRNGKGNLIEQVRGKVGDIDFAPGEGDVSKRKIEFFGTDGRVIKNNAGEPIIADSGIAATGFRSKLDELLEKYSAQRAGSSEKKPLRQPLVLPTNEEVPVAETLTNDSSVLILGTASKPEFNKVDKLDQLPTEAREALLRNGAENAVAIGFRAPDTQAAVNIWLNSREINVEKEPAGVVRRTIDIASGEQVQPGYISWLEKVVPDDARISNNIEDETRLLTPVFAYNIGNAIEVTGEGKKFTGEIGATVMYDPDKKALGLMFDSSNRPVARDLFDSIKNACTDFDFQKYALVALKKKRRNPKLQITLSFKNGFVDPKETFVQS